MKKILFFLGIIILFGACKYDDEGYSFVREWDDGCYITKSGVVKYISGKKDTAKIVSDVYAEVLQTIRYIDLPAVEGASYFPNPASKDSILVIGHCWAEQPDIPYIPLSSNADTMSTKYFRGENSPNKYMDTLKSGTEFYSTLYLKPETKYNVRSYVITGRITNDGDVIYRDTAYNQYIYPMKTNPPQDVWTKKSDFDGERSRGAVSFTYNGNLYAGMGYDESGASNKIYEYDPLADSWKQVAIHPGIEIPYYGNVKPSNCVAFVIKDVEVNLEVYKDFVYIGTGFYLNSAGDTTYLDDFMRLDLSSLVEGGQGEWQKMDGNSAFEGPKRQNAVAFTLDGIGYVGLGDAGQYIILPDFYKLDPSNTDNNHTYGTWKKITSFPSDLQKIGRTKAVAFTIDDHAYISCGKDQYGEYKNDLWRFTQEASGDGSWGRKKGMPGNARVEAVGFAIGKLGYVGTGFDGDTVLTDFWRYNPHSNSWNSIAEYSGEARMEAVGGGVLYADGDYRGYVGLGRGSSVIDYFIDMWEYRP